jgi:hypothetical protein
MKFSSDSALNADRGLGKAKAQVASKMSKEQHSLREPLAPKPAVRKA